jgi:hypothetical protein
LDCSLSLPRAPSWKDIFNWDNFKNTGETLFSTFAPSKLMPLYQAYNFGRTVYQFPQLIRKTRKLKNKFILLYERDDRGISDVIPLISKGKNLAFSWAQTVNTVRTSFAQVKGLATPLLTSGYESYTRGILIYDLASSLQGLKKEALDSASSHFSSLRDTGLSVLGVAASSFGPRVSSDSLLSIHGGINLGVNGHERNLMSLNYGAQGFVNTFSLESGYGENKGILACATVRVKGSNGYDNEGNLFGLTGTVNGGDVHLGGRTKFYRLFSSSGDNIFVDGMHEGKTLTYNASETVHIHQGATVTSHDVSAHGKNVIHEGNIKADQGVASVTADQDLITTDGSSITGKVATAKADGRVLIGGELNGKDYAQAFGAQETTVTSTGAVKGEKDRRIGIDFYSTKDETGQSQIAVLSSQKTDVQGQIQDTSTQDHSESRSFVGGHQVDVRNQVQSYGRTDVIALENLHIHKDASVTGQDVSAHSKNVFHEGDIKADQGVASVTADQDLITTDGSSITGKVATAKADGRVLIGGELNGKDYAQAFGAQETIVTSTGTVKGEKDRRIGIDFYSTKDETGQSQIAVLYSKKTDVQGKILDSSPQDHSQSYTLIDGHQVDVRNHVQSHGKTDIHALKGLHIHQGASLKGQGVSVQAHDITYEGETDAREKAIFLATGKLQTSDKSSIKAKEKVLAAGEDAKIRGHFEGETLVVEAKGKVDIDADLHEEKSASIIGRDVVAKGTHISKVLTYKASGVLQTDLEATASKKITMVGNNVESRGNHSARKIKLRATESLDNYAKFRASESLAAQSEGVICNYGELSSNAIFSRSKWMYNEGTVHADTQLDMGIDYGLLNVGCLYSDNSTLINAGAFINLLGDVKGQSSLRVNSLLNLNAGLMRGHNIATNSLASFNVGLYVPTMPSSWTDLFSWSTVTIVARNLSPTMGSVLGTAKTGYSLIKQGGQIASKIKDMSTGKARISLSELIGVAADVKEFGENGVQFAWNKYTDSINGIVGRDEQPKSTNKPLDSCCVSSYEIFIPPVFYEVIDSFKPSYHADSILSLNTGVVLGHNGRERNIFDLNYGVKGFSGTYTLNTISGWNGGPIGTIVAHDLNIEARNSYTSTGTLGGITGSITGPNVNIGGHTGFIKSFHVKGDNINFTAQVHNSTSNLSLIANETLTYNSHTNVQEATLHSKGKATLAEGAYLHGQEVDVLAKDIEHNGKVSAENLAALRAGTVKNNEDGTQTFVADGNLSTGKNSSISGDQAHLEANDLKHAGRVDATFASFKANTGEILNPENIHAKAAYIALGKYNGGAQGAINTANQMTNAQEVYTDAHQEDFTNTTPLTIQGEGREFIFNSVNNFAELNSNGSLSLHGINGFKTTHDIHAETGLTTVSSQGLHETLNGAVLSTTKGTNHVEGAKGLVLQSVLQEGAAIKRAGYVGDRVVRISEGNFGNTAGQTISLELVSRIRGDQQEYALECPNNTISLNVDGKEQVLHGGEKAIVTYARTEDLSDYTDEKIEGDLYTEAGIRKAYNGGITRVNGNIEAKTLQHTYEAEKGNKRSGWFGQDKEDWTKEDTDFYVPEISSPHGKFDFMSSEKSQLEGLIFNVAERSNIGGGSAAFTASVARNHYKGSESKWWGLWNKTYDGYQDVARVAHIVGEANIISEKECATFQSPIIDVGQGGIFSPRGIVSKPLILESEYNERTRGLYFSWIGNRPSETIHPIAQRITSLVRSDDGATGVLSDLTGLASATFNTTTHAAQSYNLGSNPVIFVAEETGVGRVSVGFQDTQSKYYKAQEVPGFLRARDSFFIQTNQGEEADLSGVQLDIHSLSLDTGKLRIAGTQQTSHQYNQDYKVAFSLDGFNPTAVTISADHHKSAMDETIYGQTQNTIGHLHVLKPGTEIDLQNTSLSIDRSTGENYSININDRQNEIHSTGHNEGLSLTIDMSTGMPIGGGVRFGYQDLHAYTTPQRSWVQVNEGSNLQGVRESLVKDRIEGFSFNTNYTPTLFSESPALGMPLGVSGQIGITPFRVEPLILNRDAFKRDTAIIHHASQSIIEDYYPKDSTQSHKEEIEEENLSHGLSEDDSTLFVERKITEENLEADQQETTPSISIFTTEERKDEISLELATLDLLYTLNDGSTIAIPAVSAQASSLPQDQEAYRKEEHTRPVQWVIDKLEKFKNGYASLSQFSEEVMEGKHSFIAALEAEGVEFEKLNWFQKALWLEVDSDHRFAAGLFKATEAVLPKAAEAYSYYQVGLARAGLGIAYNYVAFPQIESGMNTVGESVSGFFHDQVGLSKSLSNDLSLIAKQMGLTLVNNIGTKLTDKLGNIPSGSVLLFDMKKQRQAQKATEQITKDVLQKAGRRGKQAQLFKLMNDPKVSSSYRGWLKQEYNQVLRGKRPGLRLPYRTDLAHLPGFEASKGFDYGHAVIQSRSLHKKRHKIDKFGRRNKTPITFKDHYIIKDCPCLGCDLHKKGKQE